MKFQYSYNQMDFIRTHKTQLHISPVFFFLSWNTLRVTAAFKFKNCPFRFTFLYFLTVLKDSRFENYFEIFLLN